MSTNEFFNEINNDLFFLYTKEITTDKQLRGIELLSYIRRILDE
ncbi:MAG: hypothetical protein ACRCX2_22670 [Paraclostridium sp.]